MTLTYGEVGISYGAINWAYDGSELNTGATSPIDVSTIRVLYTPSKSWQLSHRPSIVANLSHKPSVAKGPIYYSAISKTASWGNRR